MIIWSVIPYEDIFSESSQNIQANNDVEEINYSNCRVLAKCLNKNEYQIVRLITTDPQDYLNEELEPGRMLFCRKEFIKLQ